MPELIQSFNVGQGKQTLTLNVDGDAMRPMLSRTEDGEIKVTLLSRDMRDVVIVGGSAAKWAEVIAAVRRAMERGVTVVGGCCEQHPVAAEAACDVGGPTP